jgi:AraC family transcriptional regulator
VLSLRLRRVLEMIESQPVRSVSELAEEVQISPAHLQRLFRREVGVHVHEVIVEHRMQRAALLLSTSQLPIKEIAFSAGYEHHSSFVRAFQRRFGRAPKRYRERNGDSGRDCLRQGEPAVKD